MGARRKPILGILLALVALATVGVTLALSEVAVRVYQRLSLGIPFTVNAATRIYLDGRSPVPFCCVLDGRIGWRPRPSLSFEGEGQRADGSRYPLRVTQDEHGFRAFGQLTTTKPRVLFLGDSFTQAVEVSDNQTYYTLIGRQLGLEVFALGARGYATLQEYLILDQVVDEVRPDLIVWQFCFNDFMANAYDLERIWTPSALGIPRPFLEDGEIRLRIPEPHAWLLELPGGSSRLLALVTIRYHRLRFILDGHRDVLLENIRQRGLRHPGFNAAVTKTRQVLDMVARRAGQAPIVLWEACAAEAPFHSVLRELARQTGMHFVDDLPGAIEVAAHAGRVLHTIDRIHWNPDGHALAAQALGDYLRRSGVLEPLRRR